MSEENSSVTPVTLELSTAARNLPEIKIDGVVYHLKTARQFKFKERVQLSRDGQRMRELAAKMDASDVEDDELETLLVDMAKKAVADVPDDVLEKLTDDDRLSLVSAFFKVGGFNAENPTPAA